MLPRACDCVQPGRRLGLEPEPLIRAGPHAAFRWLRRLQPGDRCVQIAPEALCGARMLAALLIAPRAPGSEEVVDTGAVRRANVATFAHERPHRARQILELLHRLPRRRRLPEVAEAGEPDPAVNRPIENAR